jgi:hypothetical protein
METETETKTKQEIKAGGVILYKKNKTGQTIFYLQSRLISDKKIVEDFGGKIEKSDLNIYYTIARELGEETNYACNIDNYLQFITTNTHSLYIPRAKYLLLFCDLENKKINLQKSGEKEKHTGIDRTIIALDKENLLKRIENKFVNPRLYSIYNFVKFNKF